MPRLERSFRTSALILRRRDFGEADRLLTVLTPAHGRRDVIAKGARKPVSHRTGHVELFTEVDMLVARGRELDIASQTVVARPFLPLREDLRRGSYANYVAELVLRFTAESDADDDSRLYDLVAETLARLCDAPDLRLPMRYYELHLLDLTGFRPELTECVFSREPVQPVDQFFSYANGGVVSPSQTALSNALTPITVQALKLLRHMQRSAYAQVGSLSVPEAVHSEVERVLMGYITYLLEQRLQSVDFIRRVRQP